MLDVGEQIALATDLYELTMGGAYLAHGIECDATFSLFVRRLPSNRNYLVAAGLEDALDRLLRLRFDAESIDYLRSTGLLREEFLDWLAAFRFTGSVRAVPEGRVVFGNEPLLEVEAPILQAQLVETALINALHFPTLVASKAARYVSAGRGRAMVEFGLRRTPSIDAGVAAARAAFLAGFVGTSNLLAGKEFSIPVSGTMAHSFVQVFSSELEAFLAFAESFPGPVTLLIDTYDTVEGARNAVRMARELVSRGGKLAAVRIDSGDIDALSRDVRKIFDEAGLPEVQIIASGGLDEADVAALVAAGAPVDAFGIGTRLGTSSDTPYLEMVYKLVEYDNRYSVKLSKGKTTITGPKQVWRRLGPDGLYAEDLIAAADEPAPGADWEPLLEPVMREGELLAQPSLRERRAAHALEMARLPASIKSLASVPPYPVGLTPHLEAIQRSTVEKALRHSI